MANPDPGTVYRDEKGRVLMFVRTEQRPGRDRPEHLFVHTYRRVVLERWLLEPPPEAELVIDTEGRKQANELRWLLEADKQDKELLLSLLTKACMWLPAERAAELKGLWRAAQP